MGKHNYKVKKVKEKTHAVILPQKICDQASAIFEMRGTTLEKFLELTLVAFVKVKTPLRLLDIMTFGMYTGVLVEDLVRTRPDYILWLVSEGSGAKFSHEVLQLAANLTKPQTEMAF